VEDPAGKGASRLPQLGRRGEGWVALQAAIFAAIFLSAFVGSGWSGGAAAVAHAVGGLLIGAGALLLLLGGVALGPALTALPAPRAGRELTTRGIYRRARHPMYGGGMLVALGWSTIFASVAGLVLTVVLVLFFELKSRREESMLVHRYPGYADYRRRTPRRFVPFLY
jgi:protein-S-isoprenylcysteine O-methyltransferase Ste14